MNKNEPRLRLRITAAAESEVRLGHPWIFSNSIRELNRDGRVGELAVIYDRKDEFLAVGFFDPDSPIRVRVLHAGKPQTIDSAWWSARLAQAIERRRGLFDERTNGYRIINGESDGWPGLVLDRYDTTLVLKIYTVAWLPRLEEIVGLIRAQLDPERIVLRMSRNAGRRSSARRDGELLFQKPAASEFSSSVVFLETGLRFEADVVRGQKTGFFLDQRENRRMVESRARGGATSVTDLDISVHALESAKRNFALNQSEASVAACRHELVRADAFAWLEANEQRKFGLIVLDPPSFAKREVERTNAIHAYERLTALGIKHLTTDGILVACSCSAHVSAEEFLGAVRRSAVKSGRKFDELRTTHHAADHPANFSESEYLKAIYLKFAA